ncbi:DUF2089 domain-containing protein [Thermotoga profunda]|uniref:DUF2089 domain-containing protein n=1 Tax=Thermotoga profunda TaxID=1508420 RepID=UPI00059767BC|nr:DUF2089 domain-containing protein [Thermotoga profunda]
MNQFFAKCPFCNGQVVIVSYRCKNCNTKIEGQFAPNEFNNLTQEDLNFLRLYLKNRGNLTKVAEKLGVSYPTVHSYFSRVLANLGYSSSEEDSYSSVLEKLENNQIDFSTAISIIKGEKEVKS